MNQIALSILPGCAVTDAPEPSPSSLNRGIANFKPKTNANRARKVKETKLPKPLTSLESSQLLAATETERDRLIIETLLKTGLRVEEFVNLDVPDLDLVNGWLKVVCGKYGKDRTLPLHPSLSVGIRRYLAGREIGPVFLSRFSDRFTTRAIQKLVKSLANRAEIRRRVTPHHLRHTFATTLLKEGVNLAQIQMLLGHEKLDTTKIYLDVVPEDLRAGIERLKF